MFKSGQRSASQAQWSRLQHWVDSVEKVESSAAAKTSLKLTRSEHWQEKPS
jgi:hypothetical protein